MSFPRYPTYKDSGVEWLGEVPSHWHVTALKREYSVTLGKMLQTDASSPDDLLGSYLRAANIQWSGVDVSDIKTMWFSGRDVQQLRLLPGDLLISEGGDVGRSCLWQGELEECYFQNSVNRVRPIKGGSSRFLYYWMSTIKDKGYVDVLCNKSTIAHFTAEKVAAVPVPIPSDREQESISQFLDRETTKIDTLVAEQEQLITLLKEKRQAVISHAVTKGLDPSVPMKDSGVEWLGEVPAHWALRPLKSVATFRSGGTPDKRKPEYWDGDVPWVSAKDLKVEQLGDSIDHITQLALDEGAASLVPEHAIVVVVRGMILARYFPVTQLMAPMAINQDLKALLPRSNVATEYLAWLLRASEPETLNCLDEAGHGTKALRMENWGGMIVPVPPIDDQLAIAAKIDAATALLDQLVSEAVLAIELLKERRSALISAAVTGQIDVGDLAPAQEQAT